MSELYELSDGWEWKKLEDVCGKDSSNISLKMIEKDEGVYPIYGAKGLIKTISFYRRNEPYIAIIKDGAGVGRVMMCDEKSSIIATMQYLIPKNNVSIKFLFYFLSVVDFNKYVNGATIPHIYYKDYKNNPIPLPPLTEQQRIVSKLDSLFEKIDKASSLHQKNMEEADTFMASVLNDVFGELEEKYEHRLLGDLTKTTSGGTPKRNEKSYWNGNIGWLKSGELNDGYITEVEEFITEEGLKGSSAKLFPKGTLLIAMYGATVGKLGILEIETTTNQAICGILNDKNQFETLYMFYFLKTMKEKMLNDSFGGAQPNISQTYIKELEIPLPPLQIQQKVVEYLNSISEKMERVKTIQKEKMESLKALKASILDKAFRGGVVSKGRNLPK